MSYSASEIIPSNYHSPSAFCLGSDPRQGLTHPTLVTNMLYSIEDDLELNAASASQVLRVQHGPLWPAYLSTSAPSAQQLSAQSCFKPPKSSQEHRSPVLW